MDLADPLLTNLRKQARQFLVLHPSYHASVTAATSNGHLLDVFSALLSRPALTVSVATLFRPLLFDLCARWIQHPDDIQNKLIALSLLLEVHVELFPSVPSSLPSRRA
jgi:midasin